MRQLRLRKFVARFLQYPGYLKSENWGGLASMAGSALILLAHDPESVISAIAFWAAEIIFALKGHQSLGYSVGCFFFAVGDAVLCFSSATSENVALKAAVASIAATWLVAVLRFPLKLMARGLKESDRLASQRIDSVADGIQPLVGILALIQRLPTLATSAFDGVRFMPNPILFAATIFWMVSDVLCGRLQSGVSWAFRRNWR